MMDIELYKASQENLRDAAFVEDYSEERIREFSEEDALDKTTTAALRKSVSFT
jgi:hypothetical protein